MVELGKPGVEAQAEESSPFLQKARFFSKSFLLRIPLEGHSNSMEEASNCSRVGADNRSNS